MNNNPLKLIKIRKLNTNKATQNRRPSFVAAASGIVNLNSYWIIVADDENHFAYFKESNKLTPGNWLKIFESDLPLEVKERKKVKPDLEAIVLIDNAILMIPSGSKKNRVIGKLVSSDKKFPQSLKVKTINFKPLYKRLLKEFANLNIEGAAVVKNKFFLAQRGNGEQNKNALIELDYQKVLCGISKSCRIPKYCIKKIKTLNLGYVDKTKLTMTDICSYDDKHLLFLATAEATEDTYQDGEIKGSLIGLMSTTGKILWRKKIYPSNLKLEGICLKGNDLSTAYLVDDGDNPNKSASLYKVKL